VAVVDRGTECEIHVRNAGTEPFRRLTMHVHDQDRTWELVKALHGTASAGHIAQGLPDTLAPDGRATALLRLGIHRRCVHVTITALAGATLQRWRGWVFIGGEWVPARPPWPQRYMRDTQTTVTVVLTGQGTRRVITVINQGTSVLRDCSADLFAGDEVVTGLLRGRCPQRLAPEERVTLVLEERGTERAFLFAFRYIDHHGQDHVLGRDLIVGAGPPATGAQQPAHRVKL
jgi:hypothetical protein